MSFIRSPYSIVVPYPFFSLQEMRIRVSMNMFSFFGQKLYPYLKNCTIHPIRKEKELPEAIRLMNEVDSNQIICYSRKENILDLKRTTLTLID